MQKREFSTEVGGKTLTATFSNLADQTNSSVILKYGNTAVLATVVMSHHKKENIDYFPLVVDYEEKFYASGEILGSRFVRREGRPSDEAILSGRVIDRTIRPLFNQGMRNEVQVVVMVLSIDQDDPDILAINAASLALATSDVPWNGPVSAVRIAKHTGSPTFVINPEYSTRAEENIQLDAIICGKDGNINMIEAAAQELPEGDVTAAFIAASVEIEKIQIFQQEVIAAIGKQKVLMEFPKLDSEGHSLFKNLIAPKLDNAIYGKAGKTEINILKKEWEKAFKEAFSEKNIFLASDYYEEAVNSLLHTEALKNERRPDGRGLEEVRELYADAGGISPILHGTGIFYRGGTHVLSVLTLGGPKDAQLIDGMETKSEKRFMHHYNFPPFSVGEVGRMGGMNRRMTGHGALAEKALVAVIPPKEIFPYTIRIVSETMASNGSSSMGSVCASTLALMDAGVPIKAPVAGIAMGLILEELQAQKPTTTTPYKILTDIQGPEDHHGDMDFKVAGTPSGVTAIQMDVKVGGVPIPVLSEALIRGKAARIHILKTMEAAISAPRKDISPQAPKIIIMKVLIDQIGLVIGPGGKTINGIIRDTGAEIDIEDDGSVYISGKKESAEKAAAMVAGIVHEYKIGERYEGTVVKIADFGAFVRIGSTREGLVHVSEIGTFRVNAVTDVLKEGDTVPVIIIDIDDKNRVKLSIKQANPEFIKKPASYK